MNIPCRCPDIDWCLTRSLYGYGLLIPTGRPLCCQTWRRAKKRSLSFHVFFPTRRSCSATARLRFPQLESVMASPTRYRRQEMTAIAFKETNQNTLFCPVHIKKKRSYPDVPAHNAIIRIVQSLLKCPDHLTTMGSAIAQSSTN